MTYGENKRTYTLTSQLTRIAKPQAVWCSLAMLGGWLLAALGGLLMARGRRATMFRTLLGCTLALLAVSANAASPSPYVGQESREIKALSPQEISDYLSGTDGWAPYRA